MKHSHLPFYLAVFIFLLEGNNEVMGTTKKAKISNTIAEGPSQENAVESASEEVEINIWVPNKKYNGALKDVATKHFQMLDKHCRTLSPKRTKAADLFVVSEGCLLVSFLYRVIYKEIIATIWLSS